MPEKKNTSTPKGSVATQSRPKVHNHNKELLEEILKSQIDFVKEINSLKSTLSDIRVEIAKLNQIENKLKKGENLATSRGGWFWY